MKHRIHILKCQQPWFDDVADQQKCFEVRETADRQFENGDFLLLEEWDMGATKRGRSCCLVRIKYILPWTAGNIELLRPGVSVLGISWLNTMSNTEAISVLASGKFDIVRKLDKPVAKKRS